MIGCDDGGPAFPVLELKHTCGDPIIEASVGMSLREWFAGQALAGLSTCEGYATQEWPISVVTDAYSIADAMIAERNRRAGK